MRRILKLLAVSDGLFFGLRRQSAAATALSDDEGARAESGVAPRLPPQSTRSASCSVVPTDNRRMHWS
jgi:hypothetical protein